MKTLVTRILCSALNNLFEAQPNLSRFVPTQTDEREPNLSFHLANELRNYLFWLDCDFDVCKSPHGDKRPDIIFHRRGVNCLNFLVIETKRKSNPIGIEYDVEKIRHHWFAGDLQYQFGASVVINEVARDYEVRVWDRNAGMETLAISKCEFDSPLNSDDLSLDARKMLTEKAGSIVNAEQSSQPNSIAMALDLNTWIKRAYCNAWNIDSIVMGSEAKRWLTSKGILPSTWSLPATEIERIRWSRIRLTMMHSPASQLSLCPNPLENVRSANLIMFDADAFVKLSKEEQIATLLHEIGHVLNRPAPLTSTVSALGTGNYMSPDKSEQSENAADDYAFGLGFGRFIVSSLQQLQKHYPETFKTPAVDARLARVSAKLAAQGVAQ